MRILGYNNRDIDWGKRLQRRLEGFRLPSTLCSEHGLERKPINPVFFAPSDIQPGGLDDELKERLRSSQHLIVIGSPNSAKSQWVGREIEFFHSLGREKFIHYFIVDGLPHSGNPETECYHPIINELGIPEILGANINEKVYKWSFLNRERAFVQLVSKLLGVEFDSLWNRHKRRLIKRLIYWVIGVVLVLSALLTVWILNRPIDVNIALNEASKPNSNLPALSKAVVKLELENESKVDTIMTMNGAVDFKNIPHRFLNQEARIKVECEYYLPVDTMVNLSRSLVVNMYRDPTVYGNVTFYLCDGDANGLPNKTVFVNDQKVTSDEEGLVLTTIPLEKQQTFYIIKTDFPLENYTLQMPCSGYEIIRRK